MSNHYCAYLRKSRADEGMPVEETLARHEALLMDHAHKLGLTITELYREVVSGDSIAARPEMQRLLSDVEAGAWSGVLCVDITRLARGETIDQGIVAQAFKYSGTKIITPAKTYDPANEFDEEYFEFGLFMARREYKMINQRQQRGRAASVKEGKWTANKAPYGYRRVKLQGEKGWTLEPDDHAPIVQDIFRWFTEERIGSSLIARRLNDMGIPSPSGGQWLPHAVRTILDNPVYNGVVTWGKRAQVKTRSGVSRPRAAEYEMYPGRHRAIIDPEIFGIAEQLRKRNHSRPGPKQLPMKNPLSGLVICAKCGRAMVRRPYQNGRPDSLMCQQTFCDNVSADLCDVERAVIDSMRVWLAGFTRDEASVPADTETAAEIRAITAHENELSRLAAQLDRAYELVEQGVYTADVFLDRSRKIADRRAELEEKIAALRSDVQHRQEIAASREQIAPKMTHVLDAYDAAQTPAEKNALLRSVLEKVVYRKDQRDRWGGDGFHIDIFPLLPHV